MLLIFTHNISSLFSATSFGGVKLRGELAMDDYLYQCSSRLLLLHSLQSQSAGDVRRRSADSGSLSYRSTLLSEDGALDHKGHRSVGLVMNTELYRTSLPLLFL